MATILNILGKLRDNDKFLTIDPQSFGTAPSKPEKQDPEKNWRQELDELARRFQGMPSTEEAERRLSALEAEIAAHAKEIEDRISAAQKALKTPFLSPLEQTHLRQEAAALEERLSDFRKNVRCRLAQAKAAVETCKEWNPLRPRYEELKKRKAEIEKAVSRV